MNQMNKLLLYQIIIFTTLYVGYGFYYFTRKSISYMIPFMNDSLNITKNDIGITISGLNLAYALSKFIGGIATDVLSCRALFGAGLFLSGLLNISLNKGVKVPTLYSSSFLIGLTQGPSWPCCAKILQNWIPKTYFGTAWSVLSTSANVAGAIGPAISTWFAINYHWSYGFMIPGCITMTVGYLSIILLRNKPADIGINSVSYTNPNTEKSNDDNKEFNRMEQCFKMFKYPYFLSLCVCYFTVQLVKTLFSDWSVLYLMKAVKLDNYTASNFLTAFEIAGIFSSFFSGAVTDYKISKKKAKENGEEQKSARLPLLLFYIVLLLASLHLFVYYINSSTNYYFILFVGFVAGFSSYGPITLIGVMAMEFAPKKLSGTSHSIVALAANVGAVCAGVPFSMFSKLYSWKFAFSFVQLQILLTFLFVFIFRNFNSKFTIVSSTSAVKIKSQ